MCLRFIADNYPCFLFSSILDGCGLGNKSLLLLCIIFPYGSIRVVKDESKRAISLSNSGFSVALHF